MTNRRLLLACALTALFARDTPLTACCPAPPVPVGCPAANGFFIQQPSPPPSRPMPMPARPGSVAELLEDEGGALAANLNNFPGFEGGSAAPDFRDRYAGVSALRVTPLQRYSHILPGWDFPIVEKPKPGEFRYVRFAWKKVGGSGIMLQLCGDNYRTIRRYHAGQNATGWESMQLRATIPGGWEVVTRDLYQDFGPFRLMGLAFTPMDGEAGLFDHIYLGRTPEDLDKVAPPGRRADGARLTEPQIEALWKDLGDDDAAISAAACWRLAADPGGVSFLCGQLAARGEVADERQVSRLIQDLDSGRFALREAASRGLTELGEAAVPFLQWHLRAAPSAEAVERIGRILRRREPDGFDWTPERLRTLRALRALESAGGDEARRVLERVAGRSEPPLAEEAKAAAARLSP
jgi:hypothetical protein